MSHETFFLFITIALVIISLPTWFYSKSWGYKPMGVLTVVLVLFLIWAFAAGRPFFRHSLGTDIKSTGHGMSDSMRRDVQ